MADPKSRRPVRVEVRAVADLAGSGQQGVLVQFEQGWMVLAPIQARELAAMIVSVADEVEDGNERA